MDQPRRVLPDYVRERMHSGHDPLLVCAYDDDEKCRKVALEDSIPLSDLRAREDEISKDRELVFYCA